MKLKLLCLEKDVFALFQRFLVVVDSPLDWNDAACKYNVCLKCETLSTDQGFKNNSFTMAGFILKDGKLPCSCKCCVNAEGYEQN